MELSLIFFLLFFFLFFLLCDAQYVAFTGATIFIFIQLVILIDFAGWASSLPLFFSFYIIFLFFFSLFFTATWSQSWVGKWENSDSKWWLALLIGTGVAFFLAVLVITVLMYGE